MKMNGGIARADLGAENVDAVNDGAPNLGRHIENMKAFGVPVVVAINHFVTDTDAEVQAVVDYVATHGSEAILCKHWEHGSKGIEELSKRVVEIADANIAQFAPLYPDDMPLFDKIETIAKRVYRADEVMADKKIRAQLKTSRLIRTCAVRLPATRFQFARCDFQPVLVSSSLSAARL
jgi:formate--tetrahydrofolate ligase